MKAVETNYYVQPHQTIIHADVVEVDRKIKAHREFRCMCCGRQWTENINIPQVIEDPKVENNLNEYYSQITYCKPNH